MVYKNRDLDMEKITSEAIGSPVCGTLCCVFWDLSLFFLEDWFRMLEKVKNGIIF